MSRSKLIAGNSSKAGITRGNQSASDRTVSNRNHRVALRFSGPGPTSVVHSMTKDNLLYIRDLREARRERRAAQINSFAYKGKSCHFGLHQANIERETYVLIRFRGPTKQIAC